MNVIKMGDDRRRYRQNGGCGGGFRYASIVSGESNTPAAAGWTMPILLLLRLGTDVPRRIA